MRLRSHLMVLVLAAVIPVLAFAVYLLVGHDERQRADVHRGLKENARALSIAVDRELQASIATLEALSTSEFLDSGNIRKLYNQAQRVVKSRPTWVAIVLYEMSGQQLFHTGRPFGETRLPSAGSREQFRQTIETGRPTVSDLFLGKVTNLHLVLIDVPAFRNGSIKYVLAAAIRPETFNALLLEQKLRPDWIAMVIDKKKIVMARTRALDTFFGRPVSARLAAASAEAEEGASTEESMEGRRIYGAFARSRLSGWTVTVAMPADSVEAPLRRSLLLMAAFGIFALLLGAGLAGWYGRRISRPIARLRAIARALGRGEPLPATRNSEIVEVNELRTAVENGSALLEQRSVRLRVRYAVSRVLAEASTPVEGVSSSLQHVCELLGWERAELSLVDRQQEALRRLAGWPAVAEDDGDRWGAGHLARLAWRRRQPAWSPVAVNGASATPGKPGEGERLAAPVEAGGQIEAVLVLGRDECGARDDELPQLLANIGREIWQFVERKRVEEERLRLLAREQQLRAEAEAASRGKDEFLAMLAHELRNPVGSISNAAHVLSRIGSQDETALRARDIIGRQVDNLSRLVDDLLDVSRVMAGKIVLDCRSIDLAEAVRESIDGLRTVGQTSDHLLEVEAQSVWIDADAVRIEQIVTNLVSNAVKYTPPGGTIAVRVAPDGDTAVLRVEDTGVGIPPHLLPRIFDLFVQGEQALDRPHGGLGIGLTLVRRLVELHGGTVEASSAGPNQGSRFTVRLPRVAASTRAAHHPIAAEGIRRHLLVVEDNRDARQSLRQLLELEGHEVYEAEDGPQGVQVALGHPIDVALIDLGLPGFDGYEVARRVRADARGKHILLVAVTGYGQDEDRRRTAEVGFDGHLVKPIDPGQLLELIAIHQKA